MTTSAFYTAFNADVWRQAFAPAPALDELQSNRLNLARVWPGSSYLEVPGSFEIFKTHSRHSLIASAAFGSVASVPGTQAEGISLI